MAQATLPELPCFPWCDQLMSAFRPQFSSTSNHDLNLPVRKANLPRTTPLHFRFVHVFLAYVLHHRVLQVIKPSAPESPTDSPLRFGILGAAGIAPLALIYPVKNHPDAVVKAVAARDQRRADAFAKKHGIPKAYGGPGSYQSA